MHSKLQQVKIVKALEMGQEFVQVVKIIRCQKKTSNKKPSAKFVALPIAVKGDGSPSFSPNWDWNTPTFT